MSERRRARELALQILFQNEFMENTSVTELIDLYQAHFSLNKEMVAFTKSIIESVRANHKKIDEIIQKYCHNWSLDRLSLIDLNILRIGVAEMLFHDPDPTPPKAAVNEALEIAKKYSSQEAPQFLNGILDQVLQKECKYES